MMRINVPRNLYWTFLKITLSPVVVAGTLPLVAAGNWKGMTLVAVWWAYVAALWCPGPFSWCLLLAANGMAAGIFFAVFIWLNLDMQGLGPMPLALPAHAEVPLAVIAGLLSAWQLATFCYFLRRRAHFVPLPAPVAGRYWLLAAGLLALPLLPRLLAGGGH